MLGKCQYFRDNFLGNYSCMVDEYHNSIHIIGVDVLYVTPSPTDTNNIIISDSVGWFGYEYVLHYDSSFEHVVVPNIKHGYFYSSDSIYVYDQFNGSWFRVLHGKKPSTGINDFSKSNVMIFPNPAHDKIYINNLNILQDKLHISIYNTIGQMILEKEYENLNTTIEINVSAFTKGIYFLKLNDANKLYNFKVLIE